MHIKCSMLSARAVRALPLILFVLLASPLIVILQDKLAAAKKNQATEDEILYVTPGQYLKPLTLGYNVAVADILWLRAVQYVGGESPSAGTYRWLYPMADTITTLDPSFDMVYHSAGIVLSVYATPKRIDESIAILKKGVENSPKEWRHPFYLSFIYFHYKSDFQEAAKYMTKTAACAKHPPYAEKLAARLYAEARNPESGILFLSKVIESTRDEKVKKELEERLVELVTERDIVHLEDALNVYKKQYGKSPAALADLVVASILRQLPKEPRGGYYYLDTDGSIKSSRMKERLRIYGKPGG